MVKIKCQRCGKEWNTKSKNLYVSCPSCLTKVKVNKGGEVDIDMGKKTTVKFVANGIVLAKYPIAGFKKGESEFIKESLSRTENIPKDFIEIEID